jgi:metal-responsive CopG/Arc/MetJ family transcriptional regulator
VNTQINVRMPQKLLQQAKLYSEKNGFGSIQEFIKETIREKVFEKSVTKKELELIKKLISVAEYGSEKELFDKLG